MSPLTSSFAKLPAAARERIGSGLQVLLDAWTLANDANSTAADFSVELDSLRDIRLADSEVRWLICKGYAEHLLDTSLPGEANRSTRPTRSLKFSGSSCLALTREGAEFASALRKKKTTQGGAAEANCTKKAGETWDPSLEFRLRELEVAGQIVKKLRIDAKNQEAILSAFEEERWPPYIADPIHPTDGMVSQDRLSKAVYDLNRGIEPGVLSFRCVDGTNVAWELHPRYRSRKKTGDGTLKRNRRP